MFLSFSTGPQIAFAQNKMIIFFTLKCQHNSRWPDPNVCLYNKSGPSYHQHDRLLRFRVRGFVIQEVMSGLHNKGFVIFSLRKWQ